MASIHDMDEFVNWDKAADSLVPSACTLDNRPAKPSHPLDTDAMPTDPDIDLVLANVEDDDFSFWALQHFNGDQTSQSHQTSDAFFGDSSHPHASHVPPPVTSEPEDISSQFFWLIPEKPCVNCAIGGFSCKTIQEGQYKGYCTSCVALRCECSFGLALDVTGRQGLTFPSNPWPAPVGEVPNQLLIPHEEAAAASLLSSSLSEASQQPAMSSSAENAATQPFGQNKNSPPPKIGARFSRESVKVLKNWLSSHSRHPYPSEEEKEMLQRQTGLNKTQISNWLANARRRGKIQPQRSTSPHVGNTWTGPIDIPRRPGTPALESNMRNMNPLERWVDSPPENEPASVTAIARAVASNSEISSGLNSPYSFAFTDDGSARSQCNASSASSVGTHTSSGGSFASAYSHASRGSFGSFGSMNQRGRRRRRRRAAPKREEKTSLTAPLKTYQCTFCTETFRTKHDWQRHEKSLHLSLERWVCAPDGPRVLNAQTNQICCVFCGQFEPDDAHIESHNHSACQERSLDERTFYRKDHLNQHLRLVHNVKFLDWSMKAWKVASPEIRSRCGFCGIVMDSWSIRVDHLAEHFKTGNTMADWKGDWGFDAPVLDMLENYIPPYLIDNERNSPFPYIASGAPAETPRSAYELIKLELAYFLVNHGDKSDTPPSDDEVRLEACRIIFASEALSLQGISAQVSWLRDLLMASDEVARSAKFGPLRSGIENRLSILKINGKDNLFEQCPLEQQLHEYVRAKILLGLTAMDDELQEEACRIVGRIEEVSTTPSDFIANWLVRLITSSTNWLANFRQRAHLPRTEDMFDFDSRPTDPKQIDSTIHNYSRLERSLGEYMDAQREKGMEPTDLDLQRQARIIIYEFDDGWNQTAADNIEWLTAFKQRHALSSQVTSSVTTAAASPTAMEGTQRQQLETIAQTQFKPMKASCQIQAVDSEAAESFLNNSPGQPIRVGTFFVNDANCYRRLARELARFVTSTMSPNNPNSHVPTDAELQHQARWILYDDDDPWNQTAADNAEWLQRFKRDVGILPPGPGLGLNGDQWNISQGGTGFAPPYAFPGKNLVAASNVTPASTTAGTNATPAATASTALTHPTTTSPNSSQSDKVEIYLRDHAQPFETNQAAIDRYVGSLATRYPRPATVFCSRELESGLVTYVNDDIARGAGFPSDEALRARARAILGCETTSADDPVLLGKFKVWVMAQQAQEQQNQELPLPWQQPAASESVLPSNMKMDLTDAEMDSILAEMNFDMDPMVISTPGRMA